MKDTVAIPLNLQPFTDALFRNVVGQEGPKRALKMFLEYYNVKRQVPNTIFLGQRGNGKTRLAREMGKGLYHFNENGVIMETTPKGVLPKLKKFLEINCSTLSGKEAFEHFLLKNVVDKDVTVFFDEASEITPVVTMALLTILQPNQIKTEYVTSSGMRMEFDFTRQSFLFATTESHKVFHALMDRLEKIALQEYSAPELGQILVRALNKKGVTVDNDVVELASSVVRGNARGAEKMAEKMVMHLKDETHFDMADWRELCNTLTIRPLGVDNTELSLLRYMEGHINGIPLNALAAKMGMTVASLQKDVESHLKRHDLMEVTTTGRALTTKGRQYLKDLDSES